MTVNYIGSVLRKSNQLISCKKKTNFKNNYKFELFELSQVAMLYMAVGQIGLGQWVGSKISSPRSTYYGL